MTDAHAAVMDAHWGGGAHPFGASWQKTMMWIFIVTDALLFSSMLCGYGYLRMASPVPWPETTKVFSIPFIALMTFILISSSATMGTAVTAARLGDNKKALLNLFCDEFINQISSCNADEILPLVIAYFKTPGLRDLGHSAPYFHNGQKDTLEDAVGHYIDFSNQSRAGTMRNPSEEIPHIALTQNDVEALAAFLRSLNEDYN